METKQVRYVGGSPAVDLILPDNSYVTVARGKVVDVDASLAEGLAQQSIWEPVGWGEPAEPNAPVEPEESETPETPDEPATPDEPEQNAADTNAPAGDDPGDPPKRRRGR